MKLMPLLGPNGHTIYINTDKILMIKPGSVYDWSIVIFDVDYAVSVPYDMEELIKMINEYILS